MSIAQSQQVVIVGGAIIGSFCAWSLRQAGFEGDITVIERDPSYQRSSTALSAASIRTQFATPVNIAMSLHAADMFRNVKSVFGDDADIGFHERGYLILGGIAAAAERRAAVEMQRAHGADIVAMTPDDLLRRFPGLSIEGIGIGTFGRRDEGWFDAWSLLSLVKRAARQRGVRYLEATVEGFEIRRGMISEVNLKSGERVPADICVLAAGALSGRLVASIGITLPVVPKKRTVFAFGSPFRLHDFPMLFDPSGIWIRPEGTGYIGGMQPPELADVDADDDFEPHHDLMESAFWPALMARIPAMEALRLNSAWAGHYEVNTLDHNGIVGPHDELANLIFATGFSGHGVMHAPAVGRAIAELVTLGRFESIDLTPLGWERIRTSTPLVESIVY